MTAKLVGVVVGAVAVFALSAALTGGDPESPDQAAVEIFAPTPTPEPTPAPEPTAVPTPTAVPPARFTLSFTGDLLSHGPVIEQARRDGAETGLEFDYGPMLARVAPLVSAADIAVCHVETPISSDNTALSGYPVFNAPRELADGIAAAGFDTCSIASNHALDRGFTGITSTLDQLDRVGVAHTGTARSAEEQANPPIYEVGNVRVGHLSYTYGTNGIPVPADAPWSVNVTSIEGVLVQAAALREAGSDFTVLSIQWGNEYQQAPTPVQIEQATAFLESPDIDLIVGEHVHVAQPVDIINDKVVLYGIGNFLSNQSPQSCNSCPAASQDGMIFTVTVEETAPGVLETTHVSVTPTYVDRAFYEIVPVPQGLVDPDVDAGLADALRGAWERVNQAIFALDAPTTLVTVEPMPLTP